MRRRFRERSATVIEQSPCLLLRSRFAQVPPRGRGGGTGPLDHPARRVRRRNSAIVCHVRRDTVEYDAASPLVVVDEQRILERNGSEKRRIADTIPRPSAIFNDQSESGWPRAVRPIVSARYGNPWVRETQPHVEPH